MLEGSIDDSSKSLLGYKELKEISTKQFLESPIFGGKISTGHHFWIDYLARFGIVGIIPYVLIISAFTLYINKLVSRKSFIIYINSLMLFIYIGIQKNITSSMPLIIFFIVPFLLFYFDKQSRLAMKGTLSIRPQKITT